MMICEPVVTLRTAMTDAGRTLPEDAKPLLKLASTTPVLEVIRRMGTIG
jgi:hypothetical protein